MPFCTSTRLSRQRRGSATARGAGDAVAGVGGFGATIAGVLVHELGCGAISLRVVSPPLAATPGPGAASGPVAIAAGRPSLRRRYRKFSHRCRCYPKSADVSPDWFGACVLDVGITEDRRFAGDLATAPLSVASADLTLRGSSRRRSPPCSSWSPSLVGLAREQGSATSEGARSQRGPPDGPRRQALVCSSRLGCVSKKAAAAPMPLASP
jgi:hypothetical protein